MARRQLGFLILMLVLVLVCEPAVNVMAEDVVYNNKPECDIVFNSFPYCLDFLMGLSYKPSPKCCNHVKKLNIIAKHKKGNARRFCYCIEAMVKGTRPPILASRINQLPKKCNTHLSFPISSSMDCSK